ncbi:translocation/assembly module TamB domain-containing protein [Flavobacterium sp. CYK-55]|uniref:translocation/assembly module TamB domain-containing protein n=1 Tax=Flavobacterium sp. CYK-55 TaxID=2835529 RepID=UPI0020BE3B22|nr:translocation/assembly module TamB domain-containing protein [Flavobacterium sp. CYK-55]
MFLLLLLLALGIALTLPSVQTRIGQRLTQWLNETYKTDIRVGQVSVTSFGVVKLKQVLVRDHKKDTLIYAKRINTNILDIKRLIDGDLLFGNINVDGLLLDMKTYKGEKDTNLDAFIAAFDDGKPSSGKFLFTAHEITVNKSHFRLTDYNREIPKDADFSKLNAVLENFEIHGPNVTTDIDRMSFLDHRGLYVRNLQSKFSYTKKQILMRNVDLITAHSLFKGNVALNYKREDFSDFNNKVNFNILVDQASLSTSDVWYFYKEIGKGQNFTLKSHVTGTLNNLTAHKLNLTDSKCTHIAGDVNFKNLFGKAHQPFEMKGTFRKVMSDYQHLVKLLPNVLGSKLPTSLKKIGLFNMHGQVDVTVQKLIADFYMTTALGNVESSLQMYDIDNIDNAKYKGNIILETFDIGSFLGKKDLGKVSLNIDVDGQGFIQKYLNTTFSGDIYRLQYNGYNYSKVIVDGNFKNPVFKGQVYINDPNLFLDFNGSANLGRKEIAYNFETQIDYANLKKLNFVKNDSIAVFKGGIKVNVLGNSLDDLKGDIHFSQTAYQNNKDRYYFEDFTLHSEFDANNTRTISLKSPDIIDGKVVGKFEIASLRKMLENSAGSLYANYSRNEVKKGQYLKFDFAIYNKIVEVFYPGIEIGKNTHIRGSIDSDTDDFKFNFISPQIIAYENTLDNIRIDIDNKNPLFNTYVSLDTIKTKKYKIRDFSLINVTTKDTLYLRSEFRGGEKGDDAYSLNLYHTIDAQRNNVVGIQKSELKYNDFMWYLNQQDEANNKIVFDKKFKNFNIDDIALSHDNQQVRLNGTLNGNQNKDLNLIFKEVQLDRLLPVIDEFKMAGNLNGTVHVKQVNSVYQPTSSVKIDALKLNDIALGTLKLNVTGDNSLQKFYLNSSIENENLKSFTADGYLDIINQKTKLNLDLNFEQFDLAVLGNIAKDVITDVRGKASGRANIAGTFDDLDINGRLFVNGAGLKVPYLNVDYQVEDGTIVDVTEKKFIIRDTDVTDTKYKTKGQLFGSIGHTNFSDWNLDLNLSSRRILALDTKDSEDAAYFGTAFMDGEATITGPINKLFINVSGKSEKGTQIKIPINDAESVSDNNYIHFVTKKEKFNTQSNSEKKEKKYDGVELEFDFDITPDAEVEIILDRNSGHGMKGKGFGSLLFKINTLGKFNMWGDFQAYEGTYNFKYGGIINKQFKIKKGGSVTWEGDPMKANLNLEAVYKTSANPAVLVENPSFNKKVDVEVVIGIKGNLSNPSPDFTINFPTVSSVLKSEIQTKLDDKDVRQKQALILLSTGSFLSVDGLSQTSLTNNIYEKVGDLFGTILNQSDDKINVDVMLVSADKNPGRETDGRVGLTVSTKISDRISINGKFGVPVGGVNESTVVGDVEVQYRVNEDGTLNLRMFNKENDINYIGQGIGYTQGLGLTYQVDFTTFRQLLYKIFKNQKLEIIKNSSKEVHDSEVVPDYIHFKDKKEKKAEPEKTNQEAVPTDD